MLDKVLQTIYDSSVATAVRESATLFPVLESIHVLTLVIVVGSIAIVDLRLLGHGSHRRDAGKLIRELLPFTWMAFIVAALTGVLMFSANAMTYAANGFFLAKVAALLLAGINMAILHLGAEKTIAQWGEVLPPPRAARIAGGVSLALWILIVFFGRWIGFTLQ